MRRLRFLGISGSLREASLNSLLLRAAVRLAPPEIAVELYPGIGTLPLFNADLESTNPAGVARLRELIVTADALIIASPEYAHGVSGVIKNALDWMVGNESFVDKPVALFNTSPRATLAQAALVETLTTMSARVIPQACATVPLLGAGLSEDAIVRHPIIAPSIVAALRAMSAACFGN
jgi:chromate reductase, NAD(P)H dehydrogenase (quinone)